MKNFYLLLVGLLALLASPCLAQKSSAWSPDYDPNYAPLSKEQLSGKLRQNKSNAAELVKLIERSKAARLGDVAFRTLSTLRLQHRNNPDVLAAFCWAYLQDIDTAFRQGGDYRERTKAEIRVFEDAFNRVQQSAPRHWLALLINGYRAYVRGKEDFKVALPLLKESIRQAPNDRYIRSLCWTFHGAALNLAAMHGYIYKGKKVTFHDATKVLETAAKIDPRRTATWSTLFSIYHTDLKDKAGALRAKRGFLKACPKEWLPKLPKRIKTLFALYPN
jgi:hypothetical protein